MYWFTLEWLYVDPAYLRSSNNTLTLDIKIMMSQQQHLTYRAITMVRGALVSLIYKKASVLSIQDADPAASLTLMTADIERIVQGWQTMHEIWANATEIALAIVLLERQLGIACAVPIGVAICKLRPAWRE